MEQNYWRIWAGPYFLSNLIAFFLLFLAWKKVRWVQYLYALIFLGASWVNTRLALNSPLDYTNYAQWAWPVYREFIQGPFLGIIQPMVLSIAFGQFLVGLGFLTSGRWLKTACIGALLFLAAIMPLGLGSAFPFPIVAGLGCVLIYQRAEERSQSLGKHMSPTSAG